jgi:pyridoxal phosphate-dependent aminotransferase EpsN
VKLGISKEVLINALEEKNIEARPVWKPLHMQPLFSDVRYYPHSDSEDISERLFKQGICLPSGSNMSEKEQMRVIECILNCIGSSKIILDLRAVNQVI